MGDTEETIANESVQVQRHEVVDVDKETDAAALQSTVQQQQGKAEEIEEESKKRKAIPPRSDVWEHFSKVKISNGEERAKCKYCGKHFHCDTRTNGTSSMKAHLKICKKNPNKPVVDKQGTLQLQPSIADSSVGTISTWKFDPDELRKSFAEMIIEDEQPFVLSERPGLRKFLAKACPRFVLPSRRTTTRACVKVFDDEREKLRKFLKSNCARVSLTTDTWTAKNSQNYMCVTAHFIDNEWKLHKKSLVFSWLRATGGKTLENHWRLAWLTGDLKMFLQ